MTKVSAPEGQVHIADEVIAAIAATAVLEAEGVAGMAGYTSGELSGRISRKKPSKGVALKVEGGNVKITVEITVSSGSKIQDTAKDVQYKIKNAIETMTSLNVTEVNIHVTGLVA